MFRPASYQGWWDEIWFEQWLKLARYEEQNQKAN